MEDRARGFPTFCRCGARVSRWASKTITNPGRLFHSCPHRDEHNRYHLFKWTDESMVEEIEDMKQRLDDLERRTSTTNKDIQACESEIETPASETHSSYSLVDGYEKEIRGFEKDIKDLKIELKSFKNIVVCIVVVALFYKFLM